MAKFHRSLFKSFFQANIHRYTNVLCLFVDSLFCKKEFSKELVKKKQRIITLFYGIFWHQKCLQKICLEEY